MGRCVFIVYFSYQASFWQLHDQCTFPLIEGCLDQVFFYPDPSPDIYHLPIQVTIRHLNLTYIFLDNTAALRKKVSDSKLFLNSLFYFVETKCILSYGSFLFCNIVWPHSLWKCPYLCRSIPKLSHLGLYSLLLFIT